MIKIKINKMEKELTDKLDTYFNTILNKSLGYTEIYDIQIDFENNRILLIPHIDNPKLIELLKNTHKLSNQLESTLLNGLKSKYPDILNLNIYTNIPNKILITYTLGDTPFQINDIGILARLAAEYDDDDINKVCEINKNFNTACKDDTFWWKIIEIKYPRYVIYKDRNKYNPKEILKGMKYFLINWKSKTYDSFVSSESYTVMQMRKFINNYYETFKYLILESLWDYDYDRDIFYSVLYGLTGQKDDDIRIFKFLVHKIHNSETRILEALINNIIEQNPETGTNFIREIDNYLLSIGKQKMSNTQSIKNLLAYYINEGYQDNLEVYKFLIDESEREIDDELYIDHYLSINPDNENIKKYILSQISDDISEDKIMDILLELLEIGIYENFEPFYKKFRNKISQEGKQTLIDEINSHNDVDKVKYLKLLSDN